MTKTVLAMVLATAVGLASATAFADSKNAGGGPGNSGPGDKTVRCKVLPIMTITVLRVGLTQAPKSKNAQ